MKKIRLLLFLALSSLFYVTYNGIILPKVSAVPPEICVPIRREGDESFEMLVERGINLAQQVVESRFQRNPDLETLRVVIVGENKGMIAPLFVVKVNRYRWLDNPDVRRWMSYFPDSRLLLGFETQPSPETSPTPPPVEEK